MDLSVHFRVLSRHRVLLGIGLTVAILAALLSYVSVGPSGIHFRAGQEWQSSTRLFAATGGSLVRPENPDVPTIDATAFAVIASEFANSDAVKQEVTGKTRLPDGEAIQAFPLTDNNDDFLPFIQVDGIAPTPARARALSGRAARSVTRYVEERQVADRVPERKRVTLQVVTRPSSPELLEGRPLGPSIFLFLAIASLTIGAAYVIENLRRGPSAAADEVDKAEMSDAGQAQPLPLTRSRSHADRKTAQRRTLSLDGNAARSIERPRAEDLPRADER